MAMAMFIICLVSGGSSFMSFLLNRRKPTRTGRRITTVLAVVSLTAAVASGGLGYRTSVESEEQAFETSERVDRAEAQITEIITPRRMEPETGRMLAARVKPFAGQKYDMKVFRDRDSLELATALQGILDDAGWVYTNVYPRYATRYAETGDHGVWVVSGTVETARTTEARTGLQGALETAGLYDDSTALAAENCVEITGRIEVGSKLTRIPCSESSIQSIEVEFTLRDDVIPADTVVLHVGKERL